DRTDQGPPPTPELQYAQAITIFSGYNTFGQPTQWIEYGREMESGDEFINTRYYVSRVDDNFMLSVVAEEARIQGTTMTGTPVRTRKYYDDPNVFAATPTKGNLVKVERDTGG